MALITLLKHNQCLIISSSIWILKKIFVDMILDSQKSYKSSTKNSHIPFTQSSQMLTFFMCFIFFYIFYKINNMHTFLYVDTFFS